MPGTKILYPNLHGSSLQIELFVLQLQGRMRPFSLIATRQSGIRAITG